MKLESLFKRALKYGLVKRRLNTSSSVSGNEQIERGMSTMRKVAPKVDDIKKTALYDMHVANKGKLVNFAGYYLPIQYSDLSISDSHIHTRSKCSVFDVSHMLQTNIYGKDSVQFMESLCVTDIAGMKNNQSTLSLFVEDKTGGIIDDLIITKVSDDHLYIVSNASRQTVDKQLILNKLDSYLSKGKDVFVEFLDSDDRSLIAVQGPDSAELVQTLIDVDLKDLYFMNSTLATICGIKNCRITRCGYTGEDGVEISVPSESACEIVQGLLDHESASLAGLGARDTLRLEAGLCLYGNDIDESTTPVEACLTWTISPKRRTDKNLPGADVIARQLKDGVSRKRIGIVKVGGPPARSGTQIVGFNDNVVGHITSGCPAPSLGLNVAIGYVGTAYAKQKTDIRLRIRDRLYNGVVSKMPFIPAKYYVKPKK